MALKPKAIRAMPADDRAKALRETRAELMHERGLAAMGGSVKNPGRIRDLRTTIARVLTIQREERLAAARAAGKVAPRQPRKGTRPPEQVAGAIKADKAAAKKAAKPARAPAKAAAKSPAKTRAAKGEAGGER